MRSLDALVSTGRSAMGEVRRLVEAAENCCTILEPEGDRDRSLLAVQVATDLPLGAIAYETGGILVDSGWLRYLGCGHARLPRSLADWNRERADGLCLVADDVVGGFFALDRGAFGDSGDMYYLAPDSLQWEPIGFEFDFFFRWSLTPALGDFYQHFRWPNWTHDIAGALPTDHAFLFDPPLWDPAGAVSTSARCTQPVIDLYALKCNAL